MIGRIGLPVARPGPESPAWSMARAFRSFGFDASILTPSEFREELRAGRFTLFFGIDSEEPFRVHEWAAERASLSRVGFWFTESRRRPRESLDAALGLVSRGGFAYQAQYEDVEYCRVHGVPCSWLPPAADPDLWTDEPPVVKQFHLGFAGRIGDRARRWALDTLGALPGVRLGTKSRGPAWVEDGSLLLRSSLAGFNISSSYGAPEAYDVNRRVFETLSSGTPLITNEVPSLERLFGPAAPYLRTYRSLAELVPTVRLSLNDREFLSSGTRAREEIMARHSYRTRVEEVVHRFLRRAGRT